MAGLPTHTVVVKLVADTSQFEAAVARLNRLAEKFPVLVPPKRGFWSRLRDLLWRRG